MPDKLFCCSCSFLLSFIFCFYLFADVAVNVIFYGRIAVTFYFPESIDMNSCKQYLMTYFDSSLLCACFHLANDFSALISFAFLHHYCLCGHI